MTTPLHIPAHEAGVLRLFSLSMTEDEAQALLQVPEDEDAPHPLKTALGAETLDTEFVEVFPISNLEGLGLAGYLHEGNDVPREALKPDAAKLAKLGGWVLIAHSSAFRDAAQTLRPVPELTLVGAYPQEGTDWRATENVTSEAAKPYTAPPETVKKRPSDAAMSGRIATVVLILLGLFTWAIIWIAG